MRPMVVASILLAAVALAPQSASARPHHSHVGVDLGLGFMFADGFCCPAPIYRYDYYAPAYVYQPSYVVEPAPVVVEHYSYYQPMYPTQTYNGYSVRPGSIGATSYGVTHTYVREVVPVAPTTVVYGSASPVIYGNIGYWGWGPRGGGGPHWGGRDAWRGGWHRGGGWHGGPGRH